MQQRQDAAAGREAGEYLPGVPRLGRAATAQGPPDVTATTGKNQANPDGYPFAPVNTDRCPTSYTRAPTQLAQQSEAISLLSLKMA